jgi:putative flippase GtrA
VKIGKWGLHTEPNSLTRYLATGGLNTCLAYIYFYVLYCISPLGGIARINTSLYGSMAISVVASYALQKRFVWDGISRRDSHRSAKKPSKPSPKASNLENPIRFLIFGLSAFTLVFISALTSSFLDSRLHVDPRISQLVFTPLFAMTSYCINRRIFTGRWRQAS